MYKANKKFAIYYEYLKREVKDKFVFLHEDYCQSCVQNNAAIFGNYYQAFI